MRGKIRAGHYRMLGKTGSSYSNRSFMSSVIEDSITSGRLSPYEQSLISRGSKRSRTRNISLLAQCQEYTTGNAFSFKAHQKTSRGRLTTNHGYLLLRARPSSETLPCPANQRRMPGSRGRGISLATWPRPGRLLLSEGRAGAPVRRPRRNSSLPRGGCGPDSRRP